MIYLLLKSVQTLPLTIEIVENFLYRAAKLAVIGEISVDDWKYLTRLVMFRVHKVETRP